MDDLVKRYFAATGLLDLSGEKTFERMEPLMQLLPGGTDFVKELRELWNPDELASRLAFALKQHFAYEELYEIVQFFESPAGQKYVGTRAEVNRSLAIVLEKYCDELSTVANRKVDNIPLN